MLQQLQRALDGLVERQPLDLVVTDLRGAVAGPQARPTGRRVLVSREHAHRTRIEADFHAKAGEAATVVLHELAIRGGIEVVGIRIEPQQHAADDIRPQLLLVDGVCLPGLDLLDDFFQRVQRRIRAAIGGGG